MFSLYHRVDRDILKAIVEQVSPDKITALILVFNTETNGGLAEAIQDYYCLKLENDGKNAILWDCQISLQQGFGKYAWQRYQEAGYPLETMDGTPFHAYLEPLRGQGKNQFFINEFDKYHHKESMVPCDLEASTSESTLTQDMRETMKRLRDPGEAFNDHDSDAKRQKK